MEIDPSEFVYRYIGRYFTDAEEGQENDRRRYAAIIRMVKIALICAAINRKR